ncbi:hypothetical protein [Syntrophus gentianae]|uniref:hypothetical protein n=1 Tax=Syntrophus gentianae TaxID=43775 RepID=UPI000B830155|nr:hypothetical protein [Syntrophus gentianae]
MNKIPPYAWHSINSKLAWTIQEAMEELVINTQSQYKNTSQEYKDIKNFAELFLSWRNCMYRNFNSERVMPRGKNPWCGNPNRPKREGHK